MLERFYKLWERIGTWGARPPMLMYPDDVLVTLQYHRRLSHLNMPNPREGEASEAHTCFLVKKYVDKREMFWVDTETREVNRLALLLIYKGYPERYANLEIGTPTKK